MIVDAVRKLPPGPLRDFAKKTFHQANRWKLRNTIDFRVEPEEYHARFLQGELEGLDVRFSKSIDSTTVFACLRELPEYMRAFTAGNVVVDAGAFPGEFSVVAARLGARHVYAFEPNAENRAYLHDTLARNEVHDVVEVLPFALTNRTGIGFLQGTGVTSSLNTNKGSLVPVTTLDAVLQASPDTLVKMDVEGAELEVVQGARSFLDAGASFIIAAYHIVHGRPSHEHLQPFFEHNKYVTRLDRTTDAKLIANYTG